MTDSGMNILVLGASGMLGASLVPYLKMQGHHVTSHSRTRSSGFETADLSNSEDTTSLLQRLSPKVAVNLAGLTDVDRCESHPKEAWLANVRSVENVASACKAAGTHLIHISTDQIYDSAPACMESEASPGNQYAMTKYAGELAALTTSATVLRTNFFGASRHVTRRSLTDWLLGALRESRAIQVFDNVRFSPLCMATLCEMIEKTATQRFAGIFNLGSHGGMSKADFAFAFAQELGFSTRDMSRMQVNQASTLLAWRPSNMCMNSTRYESVFRLALPTLGEEIQRAAKDYRELF